MNLSIVDQTPAMTTDVFHILFLTVLFRRHQSTIGEREPDSANGLTVQTPAGPKTTLLMRTTFDQRSRKECEEYL
jgi:hypothetical protein